jgi:hypothetical protein
VQRGHGVEGILRYPQRHLRIAIFDRLCHGFSSAIWLRSAKADIADIVYRSKITISAR